MKSGIGIKKVDQQEVFKILSKVYADEFVLFTKTLGAYSNVEGTRFFEMRNFFWNQFVLYERMIDRVSEHFRIMERHAPSTLKQFLDLTHLKEITPEKYDSTSLIKDLLNDHEIIIKILEENKNIFENDLNYSRGSNIMNDLLEKHEQMAWMLKAHLK